MLIRIVVLIVLAEVLRKTQSATALKDPFGDPWG
jgi:hypothetical protein